MIEKERNPYRKLVDGSRLRPFKEVESFLAVEKDPILLRKLRYERRLIFFEMYWNGEIDFEMFSKLIKGEVIWLE